MMKKLLASVLALIMIFCVASAIADEVKLGMIGPLTGPYAIYGNAAVYGAKIAADELNALNSDIQYLIVEKDDQGDGVMGKSDYDALLDDGALAIIGTVTSGSCNNVASYAYDERIFMLTPTASADNVIAGRDNVYQVCFRDSAQGSASAQYIAEHMADKKIGIIYNNSLDYSIGIRSTFKSTAEELGLEIVAESAFDNDANADFSVQVSEMQKSGAEIVFLPIYYTPASMIMIQAKAAEYAPVFFGVDGMDGILTLEGFDPSLAEGVMLLTPFAADAEDELTKNFVAKYVELYGETPNQFAADGYDAMYAFDKAFRAAGLTADASPEEVCEAMIAAMQTIEITGVTGTMHWDATGAVNKTPMAVVIENGVYVLAK